MDDANDIHATARSWFLARIVNGATPEVWRGGELDGVLYFPIELDGVDYWLTEVGLFTPPDSDSGMEGPRDAGEGL